MSEYKIGTIRQPKGEPVTTYASDTPSDAPEPAEPEPAKPIEGDTPLPDLDTDNKDETEDEE